MQVLTKLRYIFDRETKVKLVILLAAIIIGAFIEMLALTIISPLISIIMDSSMIESSHYIKFVYDFLKIPSPNVFLALLASSLAAIYIFRGVYQYALSKIQYRFVARRQMNISDQLLHKIMGYPYLYHTEKNIAELQRIIQSDTYYMATTVINILCLISELFTTFFILLYLVIVSPVITLGMVAFALLVTAIYFIKFRKVIAQSGIENRDASIGRTKAIMQALGGIKEIKLLQREEYFHSVAKESGDVYVDTNTRNNILGALPKLLIESLCISGAFFLAGIYLFFGTDIIDFLPQIGLFVLAAFRLLPAISRQIGYINAVSFNKSSIDAVYRSLYEEDLKSNRQKLPANTEIPIIKNGIDVRNVTFQYPKTSAPVINSVSLTIPEKRSIAFIGPTGGGKTTLADIILGILPPKSGGVFFNGESIHHNFKKWSHNVGYIPQFIYLLDESILENVAFGISRDEIETECAWSCLEKVQLADFVRSLPDGIETVVGDRGIRLSGGQRQRIGIARALYNNPSVLVLDEATSSLDTETEKAVMDAVDKFKGDKTMIIIAHRLTTIENCDIIYRVENGEVTREK